MIRDTDADWSTIAENEPYFGVLANSEYLNGNITADARVRFYESGVSDITHVVNSVRAHLCPDFHPAVAVDFGSGVGRLSIAMREVADRVIGVDVAPSMRSIASAEAQARGLTNIDFAEQAPSEGLDWVNSLIVFQHIPPTRGYELLRGLAQALSDGGVLSVQITTHRDHRHLHEVFRDVETARFDGLEMNVLSTRPAGAVGHMSMFDYDLGYVYAMLTGLGFGKLWVEHTDHAGVHGAWIFAQRSVNSSGDG